MSTVRALHALSSDAVDLEKRLKAALDFVKYVCVLGPDNTAENIEKTSGSVLRLRYHYAPGGAYLKRAEKKPEQMDYAADLSLDPLTQQVKSIVDKYSWYYHLDDYDQAEQYDKHAIARKTAHDPLIDCNVSMDNEWLLRLSLRATESRFGNCNVMCAVVSEYLWRRPAGIFRIECYALSDVNHVLMIVNREGKIEDSRTWGKDCWVIDAWQDLVFPAKLFLQRYYEIKKFALWQKEQARAMNLASPDKMNPKKGCLLDDDAIWDLRPQQEPYPGYANDRKMRFEDYYTYTYTPKGERKRVAEDKKKQLEVIRSCITPITQLTDAKQRASFFKAAKDRMKPPRFLPKKETQEFKP